MKPRIATVILAAGSSSRMGQPKQLLQYEGKPLLRRAAETALASECEHAIVVLGASAAQLRSSLEDLPVAIVENARWCEGMGASIQAGVHAASAGDFDAVILMLADQPLITSRNLDRLVLAHLTSGRPVIASRYAGTVGVPVLFSREYFPALSALTPSQGCKGLILEHSARAVWLDCPEAGFDVDTRDDYLRLCRAGTPASATSPSQ